MSGFESIDLVIYINLDHRTDRREQMEGEFKRLNVPEEKILRWSATRILKNGALGATTSHIEVLKYILTLGEEVKTVLILEDDFNFIGDTQLVHDSLRQFTAKPREIWNMILLSGVIGESRSYDDLISITLFAQGAAGYLINRSAVKDLLANFEAGKAGLIKVDNPRYYALDIYWHHFMKDGKTFYFNKFLGYQRESYSNITQTIKSSESFVNKKEDMALKYVKGYSLP